MRLPASLATGAVAVGLLAAGCGSSGSVTVPALVKAPPQKADLGWVEQYPTGKSALVFSVSSFAVTRAGWAADVSVENRTAVGWKVGDPTTSAELQFGVMLFPNDDLGALEQRSQTGDLPAIRQAARFEPALPSVLAPGARWRGTMSAAGALAGGLWIRLSFGPFASLGVPPAGAVSPVVWFTDHAHQLVQVGAVPAQATP